MQNKILGDLSEHQCFLSNLHCKHVATIVCISAVKLVGWMVKTTKTDSRLKKMGFFFQASHGRESGFTRKHTS